MKESRTEKKTCKTGHAWIIFKSILCCSCLILLFSGYAAAMPTNPPPHGKVWVEIKGKWTLVVAPPGDGPYIWIDGRWIIDPTPPPSRAEWVPGHWTSKGWVPGHWEVLGPPGPGAEWVHGHWKGNRWVPGHWKGSLPAGKKWVSGHRARDGHWVPGHWK